jgi:adenylate cyclase class 2
MKEIEMKVIDIDQKEIEAKLLQMGAKKTFDGLMITHFYDYPDHRIQKAKDLIRLRKKENTTFLTFKKYVTHATAKVREEYEVNVSDFDATDAILKNLGLNITLTIKKMRTSYQLDGTTFDFDTHMDEYSYIPVFFEIESKSVNMIQQYVKLLGIKEDAVKAWTFFDIADHYLKK